MLKRSADRKVTNLVSPNGKAAQGKNSFGLPSGIDFSCPGATSVCESICYAGKLEKLFPGVRKNLQHNWDMVKDADLSALYLMLSAMIDAFRAETDKAIAKGKDASWDFRIHWDGDFFSLDYAQAWAWVIEDNEDIRFWVYTRSFTDTLNVLPIFDAHDRGNLSLYLSVDRDNVTAAKAARKAYPWVLWAWLADTFADGREALSGRKVYPCPENGGRMPLITKKGSACLSCGVCPSARGDVLFAIKGK